QLGNASAANGSLAAASAFNNYTVSGQFANASAGNQTVNLNAALTDTTNYTLTSGSQTNTSASINKAIVTVLGVSASNKVYDTTTNANVSASNVVVSMGDSTRADGTTLNSTNASAVVLGGRFANASAGKQTVNVNATLADSTNFTLDSSSQTQTNATIAKANVTIAGAQANNKVYDTTTNASLSNNGTATVQLGNASAANGSLAAASAFNNYTVSGQFANASAGNQTVNLNAALTDTTNYSVAAGSQTNTTATIAKANVTIAGAQANNKVYDTTTNASLSNNGTATVQLGNASAANGSLAAASAFNNYTVSGQFANASAGNQTVNLNAALTDTTNYSVAAGSQTQTSATIAKANVIINNLTVFDKVYDGARNASLKNTNATVQLGNPTAANGELANSTIFSGFAASGEFVNASAGEKKSVTIQITPQDTTNYTVSGITQFSTTANIAKAHVTVSNVRANDKVYDTTKNASLMSSGIAFAQLGNASAADGSLAQATAFKNYTVQGRFANEYAGPQTVELITALADATNFTVASNSQTTAIAVIAKANVTFFGARASDKTFDGTTTANISGGFATVQFGDLTRADGTLAGSQPFSSFRLSGNFLSPNVGKHLVKLNIFLNDTENFALSADSQLFTDASILSLDRQRSSALDVNNIASPSGNTLNVGNLLSQSAVPDKLGVKSNGMADKQIINLNLQTSIGELNSAKPLISIVNDGIRLAPQTPIPVIEKIINEDFNAQKRKNDSL
ncbi:beta strand repeat-containing protein, partial [Pandoraea sp. NPDC090278]|uniref:beta strand repeat-containing protein n=1 Tax=Pandoraea sp. NPDC090278 TaxID=3364391 RepID=UPI00383AF392